MCFIGSRTPRANKSHMRQCRHRAMRDAALLNTRAGRDPLVAVHLPQPMMAACVMAGSYSVTRELQDPWVVVRLRFDLIDVDAAPKGMERRR
jgi:hypothetical protein